MIEIEVTREIGLTQTFSGAAIQVSIEVMPEISAQGTRGAALSTINVAIERDEWPCYAAVRCNTS